MNYKNNKNRLLSFLHLFLIITALLIFSFQSTAKLDSGAVYNLPNYTTSVPLYIDNDSDLAGNSSSGAGTPSDPYVIEDLSIITAEDHGIYISGTTKNFIIKDCYIDANLFGIYIYQVAQNTVEIDNNILNSNSGGLALFENNYANITNNLCENNTVVGIYINEAHYTTVKNNTCRNNPGVGIFGAYCDHSNFIDNINYNNDQYGLNLDHSDDCNVTENTFYDNGYSGMYLQFTVSCSIWDNECYNNGYHGIYADSDGGTSITLNNIHDNTFNGIFVRSSDSTTISSNTVNVNGGTGIYLDRATNAIVQNNIVTNDGFRFSMSGLADYSALTISNNIVNGKLLGFNYGLTGTTISNNFFGQLILVDCDGTIVKDLTIRDTDYPLFLIGCDSVIVDNCDFNYNIGGSITIEGTMNCTIMNTKCSHNQAKAGIFAGGVMDTVFKNVTASHNDYGMQLVSSTNFTILDCTFNMNNFAGAFLSEGAFGNIIHNGFTNGGSVGLHFMNYDVVNITHNLFEGNTGYAIFLDSLSTNSWIHHNAFISNNLAGTSQARDDTANLNMWDDPWSMEGNYWNDHVSGNYTLDGTWKVNDTYPLGSIPPGVSEFKQYSLYFVLLLPVILISAGIYRKRKK